MKKLLAFLPLLFLFTSCYKIAEGQTGFLGPIISSTPVTYSTLHSLLTPTAGNLILDHATVGWDKNQVIESSIFYDSATSNVKVYFTGSSDSTNPAFYNQIGVATSTDMVTFTKSASNPLIGMGHGGAPSGRRAHSSWVGKVGSTYYAFALNGYGYNYTGEDRNIYGYTSTDGTTWTDLGIKFNKSTSYSSALDGFGNTGILVDEHNTPVVVNGKYVAYIDGRIGNGPWETYRAEATTLMGTWTITNKCPSMQIGGGTYGGTWAMYKNGKYYAFYQYSSGSSTLPTYLALATSTDGVNWTVREAPFMGIEATPYPNTDQIADPSITEVNGKVIMTAEYVQNSPVYFAQIRLWSYNGTFDQMISATGY